MRKLISAGIIVIAVSLAYAQLTEASWYTGNKRTGAYGVKATIYTPSSAPYLASSGESNWVSVPCCNWVQAGWRYYLGWSAAKPYVEHLINGNYGITEYGTQSWGTSVGYQVSYSFYQSNWNAYINGSYKGSWGPITTPNDVLAYSEVHDNSSNQLNTRFTSAHYLDSSGQWYLFDQWNFVADAPYKTDKYANYDYRNYGP